MAGQLNANLLLIVALVAGALIMTLLPEYLRELEDGFTLGPLEVGDYFEVTESNSATNDQEPTSVDCVPFRRSEQPFDFPPELYNHLAPNRWSHWGTDVPTRTDYPVHGVIEPFVWPASMTISASDRV